MKEKAVILLSGGMDSLVTTALALKIYTPYLLHINYGQRTEKKELSAFEKIAEYYGVEHTLVIEMNHFHKIGGSALTSEKIDVPLGLSEKGIPPTYVPFRNANLLSAAVSWAEVVGATKIYIGATEEDSAGYPDCRKEFYQAFNQVIKVGTKAQNIQIITPIIDMKKSEIVKTGVELQAPFDLTWSCYLKNDVPCRECDSCIRRERAFKEAGYMDPLLYKSCRTQ